MRSEMAYFKMEEKISEVLEQVQNCQDINTNFFAVDEKYGIDIYESEIEKLQETTQQLYKMFKDLLQEYEQNCFEEWEETQFLFEKEYYSEEKQV